MGKQLKPKSDISRTRGNKFVKTNPYLKTDEDRRHWYKSANLGKQQEKPKQNIK